MKKVVAIAILFFSYSSFSQTKLVEKVAVETPEVLVVYSATVSNEEVNFNSVLVNDDCSLVSSSKSRTIDITENPLRSIRLVLPTSFNWLYYSIV